MERFEASVAAAVPVIDVLRQLVRTDEVTRIETGWQALGESAAKAVSGWQVEMPTFDMPTFDMPSVMAEIEQVESRLSSALATMIEPPALRPRWHLSKCGGPRSQLLTGDGDLRPELIVPGARLLLATGSIGDLRRWSRRGLAASRFVFVAVLWVADVPLVHRLLSLVALGSLFGTTSRWLR